MLTLKKGGVSEIHRFYPQMKEDFEKSELPPEVLFHKAILLKQQEFFLVTDSTVGIPVGYVITTPRSMYDYCLLAYFAIFPDYRDKGMGSEVLRLLHRHYGGMRGMIVEVSELPDKATADRRMDFYLRAGYKRVDCEYVLNGVPMRLLVRQGAHLPSPEPIIHRIMHNLYRNFLSESMVKKIVKIGPKKAEEPFWTKNL